MDEETTVLLAAQDPTSVRVLKAVFRNAGHQLVVVSSPDEALAQAKKEEVDLAIIEALAEEKSTLALVRKLHEVRPGIGVALLTEIGQKRSGLAALAAGVHRYLLKPLDDMACLKRTLADVMVWVDECKQEQEEEAAGLNEQAGEQAGEQGDESTEEKAQTADDEPATEEEASPVRVIVADSDSEDRAELTQALESIGCQVTPATCAQEALLDLGKDTFDVLIVGYDMGDMTADDVLLRAKRIDQAVVVIVTSAETTLNMTTSLIRRGATGFLEKPLRKPKVTAASIVRYGRDAQASRASDTSSSPSPEPPATPSLDGP
jgi:DNA-binding NtrC family response regulator